MIKKIVFNFSRKKPKSSKVEPLEEDELKRRRMGNYLKRQAYLANMSGEKKQKRREERERANRKWEELREDPEWLNKLKEQRTSYLREMPEERKKESGGGRRKWESKESQTWAVG